MGLMQDELAGRRRADAARVPSDEARNAAIEINIQFITVLKILAVI